MRRLGSGLERHHPRAAGRRRARPDGTWLRTDDGTLTFGGAAAQVARSRSGCTTGVRRGDLVVVTARTTPPYLLCWLALARSAR